MKKTTRNVIWALRKILVKAFGLTIILILCWSSVGQAIWLGQSQVNPYLEVQGKYDSNIFLASSDSGIVESAFITIVSPGIHVEFPTTKDSPYRFLANYRANLNFYNKNGDATLDPDSQLNTTEHRLDAQMRLNSATGLSLMTGYILNLASVAPAAPGDTRDKYKEHEIQAQLGYKFTDRYEVQFGYDGTLRRFDKENLVVNGILLKDDTTMHRLDATFFYRLFPSMSVLGGAGYAKIERNEDAFSNSTEYRGFGGLRYEATERLTAILKVGALKKNFNKDTFTNTTNAFVSGEAIAAFSEDTKMTLLVNRDVGETSATDRTVENGTYYIITGAKATLTHTFASLPKLTASGMLGYQRKTFPEDLVDRKDNILNIGVGGEYKFLKYVIIGVNYAHSAVDSSVNAFDYNDNQVAVSIRAIL